jgi:hypothetical protein
VIIVTGSAGLPSAIVAGSAGLPSAIVAGSASLSIAGRSAWQCAVPSVLRTFQTTVQLTTTHRPVAAYSSWDKGSTTRLAQLHYTALARKPKPSSNPISQPAEYLCSGVVGGRSLHFDSVIAVAQLRERKTAHSIKRVYALQQLVVVSGGAQLKHRPAKQVELMGACACSWGRGANIQPQAAVVRYNSRAKC